MLANLSKRGEDIFTVVTDELYACGQGIHNFFVKSSSRLDAFKGPIYRQNMIEPSIPTFGDELDATPSSWLD
jgi:hypothetical protein